MKWFKKLFSKANKQKLIYEEPGQYRILYDETTNTYSTQIICNNDKNYLAIYIKSIKKLGELNLIAKPKQ